MQFPYPGRPFFHTISISQMLLYNINDVAYPEHSL